MKKVAIIMGSQTDMKVMRQAAHALKAFDIPFEMKIVSAHRDPEEMVAFGLTAAAKYSVIIAGAGAAAHLPGMVASLTTLPVIGVPVTVGKVKGLDALLSIAQMPRGIPVACVAIDNAENAGILAARILGISEKKVAARLEKFRSKQKLKVKKMNQAVRKKRVAKA
jgi:5-(carboxyamino)imidazole ribonucleotide mutase